MDFFLMAVMATAFFATTVGGIAIGRRAERRSWLVKVARAVDEHGQARKQAIEAIRRIMATPGPTPMCDIGFVLGQLDKVERSAEARSAELDR